MHMTIVCGFYRNLIAGTDPDYPKPKSIKITKSNAIPERGSIYDFLFEKKASGVWSEWMDLVNRNREEIPANAKVRICIIVSEASHWIVNSAHYPRLMGVVSQSLCYIMN